VRPLARWRWAARERLRTLLFRNRAEVEMDRELRFHLEMEADKLVRSEGLSSHEARRRAAVAFGGVERIKEEVRDARGLDWLAGTRLDFVLGLRMLIKHPALSLVGGLGMAVAIAVSVGFFAFIEANVYPVLPLDEGDRIVALENRDVEINDEERQSLHDFVDWRKELKSVQDLAAFRTSQRNLIRSEGPPEPVQVAEMTAAGFRVARVAPLLGRYLVEADERDGAPAVVVIGHDAWTNRFARDSAIVGRDIRFGATVHTVVGVMPDGFGFPMSHQYWTPLRAEPAAYPRLKGPGIFIFGRLAPGVTMDEAQAELAVIGQRTAAAFPETHAKLRPMVMPYAHSLTDIQGTTTWMVVEMQLMMSLLLIVVALNVAVLVYARTAARTGEIALRTALGASRGRVIAQLFVEALVLSLGAAAVGLALAQVGVRMGNRLLEMEMGVPFWTDYSLRPATVLFTVGVAVLAAVIVGVLPALQATGLRLQADLRQLGGGTRMRLGKTWTVLIVAQVAIAVAALPAAVNMGWSEIRNATTRPVFPAAEFLIADLRAEPASDTRARTDARADSANIGDQVAEVLRRLEAEPAVAGASYSASLPDRIGRVEVDGASASAASPSGYRVRSQGVALDYLNLYGARVRAGRGFAPGDLGEGATAVVVNQAFVTEVLGGDRALGRRVRYIARGQAAASGEVKRGPWFQIVGVVENLQVNEVAPDLVTPELYYAVPPARAEELTVEVRVRAPTRPADFAPRLREIAAAVDPTLRLGTTYSLDQLDEQGQLAMRLVALVIGLVLLSVFLLSAAGVYALTSFTVLQRRREIGIRTALGAHPRQVLLGVFARVARQLALGLALGIAAAAVIEAGSGGELMGGRGRVLLPAFGVIMAIVALLGALGPARRGLRIQPTEALRGE
jgi:putative ABC transport system permease protein